MKLLADLDAVAGLAMVVSALLWLLIACIVELRKAPHEPAPPAPPITFLGDVEPDPGAARETLAA